VHDAARWAYVQLPNGVAVVLGNWRGVGSCLSRSGGGWLAANWVENDPAKRYGIDFKADIIRSDVIRNILIRPYTFRYPMKRRFTLFKRHCHTLISVSIYGGLLNKNWHGSCV
jgi:hypothetical protein